MTDTAHPDDPPALAILQATLAEDSATRDCMAAIYAARKPKAVGYVLAPMHPQGVAFYRVDRGRALPSTEAECRPRTAAAKAGTTLHVALGFDSREQTAYRVAVASIQATTPGADVAPIDLTWLMGQGWYTRPTDRIDGRLIDVLSADQRDQQGKPMSTEHAIARFFTPALYNFKGWVVSADSDILVRADLARLLALADPRYAVLVVKHTHTPAETTKMDGQVQSAYERKNWSSVILWNCAHPAHLVLRPQPCGILNRWAGRHLHGFRWLQDDEIGELPGEWNHLVGVHALPFAEAKQAVQIAHFTLGTPDMPGYEDSDFADEWRGVAESLKVMA